MKHRIASKPLLLGMALTLGVLALWSEAVAAAGDAAAGARSAMYCAYCHGLDGNSTYTGTPRLAGQSAEALVAKLKLYKTNQKIYHPVMAFLALGLNDQDIQDLAAYYSRQAVKLSLSPYNGPQPIK